MGNSKIDAILYSLIFTAGMLSLILSLSGFSQSASVILAFGTMMLAIGCGANNLRKDRQERHRR